MQELLSHIAPVASAVFWGLLVLSILVAAHEAGHYFAARTLNVRVTEFFLGMPSRFKLSRRSKRHGTEFGVTPILLGGYTKICGMAAPENPQLEAVYTEFMRHGRASAQEVQQALSMSEEDFFACVATLVDWAALEPYYRPEVGESESSGEWPEYFQLPAHDACGRTIFDKGFSQSDSVVPAGTLYTFAPETEASSQGANLSAPSPAEKNYHSIFQFQRKNTYCGQGFWGRVWMLFGGPLASLVTGMACFVLALCVFGVPQVQNVNQVGTVTSGTLAQELGLQAGDTITQIDGQSVSDFEELAALCKAALEKNEHFSMTIERDGSSRQLEVEPNGAQALGITAPVTTLHINPIQATRWGFAYCGQVAGFVVRLIIPTQTAQVVGESSSIMGISVMASQAASSGIADLIMFAGAISISLGFMNLLPIPPLDGGKILIEIIQAALRRPLSQRVQTYISYAGLVLFALLFIVVLKNDIVRFVLH